MPIEKNNHEEILDAIEKARREIKSAREKVFFNKGRMDFDMKMLLTNLNNVTDNLEGARKACLSVETYSND